MKLCISQATTMPASFSEDVEAFVEGGCRAMEVWLTKLEQHLTSHSAESTRENLREKEIALLAASYQGGLLVSQGEQRKAHFDHFKRRLDLCQFFEIPTLVLWADFKDPLDPQSIQRAMVSLTQAAQWADGFGVRLAVKFQAKNAFCSNLLTTLQFVQQCGEANVGVVLDVFEYTVGPSKPEDLGLLTKANLALVQLSDVAGVPRELATDADRIFPGEGEFYLAPVVTRLRQIVYDGPVSLELYNPTLWEVQHSQVVELGLGSMQRLLEAPIESS